MIVSGCERFYESVYRQKSAIKDIDYKALRAIEQKSLSKALSELQKTIIKLQKYLSDLKCSLSRLPLHQRVIKSMYLNTESKELQKKSISESISNSNKRASW